MAELAKRHPRDVTSLVLGLLPADHRAAFEFRNEPGAPRAARQALEPLFPQNDPIADDVSLVTSELATNAAKYGALSEVDGRVLVEADLATGTATAAMVRARPPKRTPTAYVTTFDVVGDEVPATSGELTLAYAPGSHGPATLAALTLEVDGPVDPALRPDVIDRMAEQFLANLARAAEDRSYAA